MKNKISKVIIALASAVAFMLSSCTKVEQSKTYSVTLNKNSLSLNVNESEQLSVSSVKCNGSEIQSYTCTWSINDESIAKVDSNGYVTAVASGSASVLAKITIPNETNVISAYCSVTVKAPTFSLSESNLILNLMGTTTATLSATFEGKETSSVSWASNDKTIATVSSSGKVTAKKVGETQITATYTNNTKYKATCDVKVISNQGTIYSVSVTPTTATIDAATNEKVQLTATVEGSDDADKSVIWRTTDKNIATVSNGLVTAVSKGVVAITAESAIDSTAKATATITVSDSRPVSVSLDKSEISIAQGRQAKLTATVLYAGNKSVTWESNTTGVSVTDGVVKVAETVAVGTVTTITARSVEDTSKFATCKVTVIEKPINDYEYTIMLYMCASTLEYDNREKIGLFSSDIIEILSVRNLPDTVKIIIETGGTKKWYLPSTAIDGKDNISATILQRWEVVPVSSSYKVTDPYSDDSVTCYNKLKWVEDLSTNKMSESSSFQSFLTWGLNDYSADQLGVIISGHGGGVGGCAYDDNNNQYSLTTKDVYSASKSALDASSRDKFTWIGYDCCLMAGIDNASVNADCYEYMIGSQESESGTGYNHDAYLSELYKDPTIAPEKLLPLIAESFVKENHDQCPWHDYYGTTYCYQTSSVLDLSKVNTVVEKFNTFSTEVTWSKVSSAFSSSNLNSFGESCYGLVDMNAFLKQYQTSYSVDTSELISAVKDAVVANYYCSYYSTAPCGINLFVPKSLDRSYALQVSMSSYQGENQTRLTTWQSMCLNNWSSY